jgi:hypothetical protein
VKTSLNLLMTVRTAAGRSGKSVSPSMPRSNDVPALASLNLTVIVQSRGSGCTEKITAPSRISGSDGLIFREAFAGRGGSHPTSIMPINRLTAALARNRCLVRLLASSRKASGCSSGWALSKGCTSLIRLTYSALRPPAACGPYSPSFPPFARLEMR